MTITNTVPALGSPPATTITKSYTLLKEIADEVDDARVYGGIHWRFDQDAGSVLGRAIARVGGQEQPPAGHPEEDCNVFTGK